MHTRRADQWYVRHDRVLIRTVRNVAVGLLAGAGTLAAPTADAAGVTVTPAETLLYELHSFTASGVVATSTATTVLFNGVPVGQVNGDVETGAYSATFPVPAAGTPGAPRCGANTVTIGSATGTVTADCAAITVSPAVTTAARLPADYTVTPANFPLAEGYQLTLDGAQQTFGFVNDGEALGFTAAPACGTHQVVLSQRYRATTVSAAAPITVLCATVTLHPPSITQPSEPAQVTATGNGFHSGQPVSVLVDGTPAGSGTTNSDGLVTVTFTANGLPCGDHQVTVTEQSTATVTAPLSATATLTVTDCRTTAAKLAVDPNVLQPDMLTEATGSGFTPGQPVTLTWQAPDGTPLLGSTTVTASSTGTIDTYCMVFENDQLGDRRLVAQQGGTQAAAPAVVDGGTMQPSTGDQLVFRR